MPCYQGTGLGCPVALLAGFPSKGERLGERLGVKVGGEIRNKKVKPFHTLGGEGRVLESGIRVL